MITYFLRALRAQLRAGRSLFLLSLFGVTLGVASVLSIQIINLSALGAFEGSLRAVSGDIDASVVGLGPELDERLFSKVLDDPDVAAAWPLYRVDVALAGQDRFFLEVLGFDLYAPMQVPWELAPGDLSLPLRQPGWVAISPRLAERFGWRQDDRFVVTSGSRRVELIVGALVDFQQVSPLASSRMVVMDIAQAQGLFGGRGELAQIDVQLRADADAERALARIRQNLGPTVELLTPEQKKAEASGLMAAFRLNLTALSLVSLVVGGFLVYTSTQAALVRRRHEFGLLRSLGMTRNRILALILGEVALLGFVGVLLGIPLGWWVARLNVDTVSASLTNFYLLYEIEQLRLPPWLWLLAFVIGLGSALVATGLPALDMARRSPRELLASYTLHERVHARAGALLLGGCALLLSTTAGWWLFLRDFRPGGFLIGVALLVSLPLMAPWVTRQATRMWKVQSFGLSYGIRALGLRLLTTSFTIAALAVTVSMLIGITLMIGSFRRTVEIWIHDTLRADVYVTTESWVRARSSAVLDPGLIAALTGDADVVAVDRLRQLTTRAGERRITLVGIDMGLPAAYNRFTLLEGSLELAQQAARQRDAVIVSEPLARKAGLAVGDDLEVIGPEGPLELEVAAISYDYSNDVGGAAMDLAAMDRLFGPGTISNVALYLRDGVVAQDHVDRLRAEFSDRPLLIRSNADIRAEVFRIFDQTFAVTRLLQVMSLLIAVAGITLTLIVLARERISELALYRALGARRRQIFRVFLGKGLGIAMFGLLMGSGGGVILAMILIFLINRAYFGWTIAIHWPWGSLAGEVLTILVAAVLASVYPAIRASRTPAAELAREDV